MEAFWEYWYWYWFLAVVFYYTAVLENTVGIKSLLSVPVQYYPPEGVGVVLSGLIYDRFSEQRDFIAAILELEVLGYVNKSIKNNGDLLIERVLNPKEIADSKANYMLEEILFSRGESTYLIPKVLYEKVRFASKRRRMLTHRAKEIVQDMQRLAEQASLWAVSEGYTKENLRRTRSRFFWISLLMIVVALVTGIATGMMPGFFLIISFFFFYLPIFMFFAGKSYGLKVFAVMLMLPLLVPVVPKLANPEVREVFFGELHLWLYLLLAVVEVAFILLYERVGALTPKGKRVKHHLKGYKVYLERVKRDEVERRKEEDPTYMDKVHPYMVLLGVENYALNLKELKFAVR